MSESLNAARIQTVRDHMALECTHEWDAVIDTFAENTGADAHASDVVMATLQAPLSSLPGNPVPPPQNPVFLLAGP